MTEKKEMSQLQRQLLGGGGAITLFTQQEFDEALEMAKAEIIAWAILATKEAMHKERMDCAEIVEDWNGEKSLKEIAEAIRNRIPSQRQ